MADKRIIRLTALICIVLMLVMTAAGCGTQNTGTALVTDPGSEAAAEDTAAEPQDGSDSAKDAAPEDASDDSGISADQSGKSDEVRVDAEEISVTDVGDIMIGQTENAKAGTGCTVFISKDGMAAGLDVRGGGPATRESALLDPLASAQSIHAIVLSGGSAYGLEAGSGVMNYLEKQGIGYDTGFAKVPFVVQTDLYDLSVGDSTVRPDADMGYEAARLAMESPNYKDGNYGAGCGASVGKIAGMDTAMKTGIGSYAIRIGDLKIGAVVAVNSLGDIYDWKTGKKIAGLMTEDKAGFRDTLEYMAQSTEAKDNKFTGNTAVGVVVTNASFDKTRLCKIAGMAHDGFARSIRPVHTSADGDSIFAVSAGNVDADEDLVGSLSAVVMSEAIKRAVFSAKSDYGLVSASDFRAAQEDSSKGGNNQASTGE